MQLSYHLPNSQRLLENHKAKREEQNDELQRVIYGGLVGTMNTVIYQQQYNTSLGRGKSITKNKQVHIEIAVPDPVNNARTHF